MIVHRLKVWSDYFSKLEDGSKTFEIRCFEDPELPIVGDHLLLFEFLEKEQKYTGKSLKMVVTYILKLSDNDSCFCLPFPKTGLPVYCMSLRRIPDTFFC